MMLEAFLIFSSCLISIHGHGYLFEPIARSSAWLVDPSFKDCCTYPSHMEMFCGGIGHQWNRNGGKCSICGEAYDKENKLFEKGGKMYLGKIVQTYKQGEEIDVKIKLSANHQGYFEFRLCNLDSTPQSDATQECLDQHLLIISDSNSTKYRDIAKHGSEMINLRLQLPFDISCQHCVFQWKYTTGNNWGKDPLTNKSGPGLGIENETFMGCSDITISPKVSTTTRRPFILFPKITKRRKDMSKSKQSNYWLVLSAKHWAKLSTMILALSSTTTTAAATTTTTKTRTMATTRLYSTSGLSLWSALLVAYEKGDEVIYNGAKYRCIVPHRSYAGVEPGPLTWALWQKIK